MNPISEIFPNKRVNKLLVIIVSLGLILVVALIVFPSKPPIPGSIKKQVTSAILIPKQSNTNDIRNTAKYDATNKLLTFRSDIKDAGTNVTVTEQPTPDQFVDIPQFEAKFFEQAGEYKTFETTIGTVHLLKPKSVVQAAAMNTKGTLIFVKPDKELTEDQWRQFFKSVAVLQ